MGRDKAMLEIDGVTMIECAIDLIRRAGIEPVVVGSFGERPRHTGARVIPDDWPAAGPLGGIATALRNTVAPWNLVMACDMPYVTAEWLEFLMDRACAASQLEEELHRTASGAEAPGQGMTLMSELKLRPPKDQFPNPICSADAMVAMNDGGAEPMCAMYHRRADAAIREALEAGIRKVTDGLAKLRVDYIERAKWKAFDSEGLLFKNVNEPADYEDAKAKLSGRAKK